MEFKVLETEFSTLIQHSNPDCLPVLRITFGIVFLTCVNWMEPSLFCVKLSRPMSMNARTAGSALDPGGMKHFAVSKSATKT